MISDRLFKAIIIMHCPGLIHVAPFLMRDISRYRISLWQYAEITLRFHQNKNNTLKAKEWKQILATMNYIEQQRKLIMLEEAIELVGKD